ncbi:MAG: diguanylate cyclase [Pseudomonadota bacterium]
MDDNPASRPAGKRIAEWLGPHALAALVLCLGLGLTYGLWHSARADAQADVQAEFDFRARELMANLDQRVSGYVQALRGVQGLFAASTEVTPQEFSSYVGAQDVNAHYPGILGVGYVERVDGPARARHEAAMRAAGRSAYAISPPGERAMYAPVTMLEPDSVENRRVIGRDPYADATRRRAIDQATDSAESAMSDPLILMRDAPGAVQTGVAVVLPLYRQGAPHASVAERRAQVSGWVFMLFHVEDLIDGMRGAHPDELAVSIFNGDGTHEAARVSGQAGAVAPGAMQRVMPITVANHRWTVEVKARPAFVAKFSTVKPGVIAATGLAATLVLTLLTWLLARSRAAARAALFTARQLTAELEAGQQRLVALADAAQRSQTMLRSILDSTIDGILVDDGGHGVLALNQRFRELWSVPEALELVGADERLVEHMVEQLMHPAPFLYSRTLQHRDLDEHRDLLRLKDGRFFEQFTRAVLLGEDQARLWSFRDITERKQVEQRERSHRHVLEMLGRSAPLYAILEAVVLGVEATNPGMLCSVMMLDGEGRRLLMTAAPSLPEPLREALHGMPIADGAGSCGMAALECMRVVVDDIAVHPYWRDLRVVAGAAEVGACWSEPIRSTAGRLLGTFAIYHGQPAHPSAANIVLIEQSAQLAGVAIEQSQAAQALRAGEERFRSLYDNAPVALWEQDWSAVREAVSLLEDEGVADLAAFLKAHPEQVRRIASLVRIVDLNSAALAQVGALDKDLAQLSLAQNFDAAAMNSFADAVAALAEGVVHFACESSFVRLDGVERQNELTLLVMPGHAYTLDFVIVTTLDITERKRMDAELLMLATTDFLTGLPNRREFMARLEDELARLQRNMDESAAVLMLDIDHFKHVNDHYGHATGDAVLRHMAGLMRSSQRKIDKLGRVGGEEFAVLLPGASAEAAAIYAERLRQSVADTPLAIDGHSIRVTVSIGIASILASDASPDAALIRADKALYSAKEAGRNRVGLPDTRAA